MRCAIVGAPMRKARAISSVVRPQTFPQRERDLRVGRDCGMTAGEDQPQSVVLELLDVVRGRVARFHVELTRKLGDRRVETRAPADPVHGLEAAGGDQPGARIRGHALLRPRLDRRGNASCSASSASSKSRSRRMRVASTRRDSLR
jgi:hypothetical protein